MLLHAYGLFQSIAHAFEPYGRTGCPRNASLDLLNTNKNATAKGGKLEYGAAGGAETPAAYMWLILIDFSRFFSMDRDTFSGHLLGNFSRTSLGILPHN